MLITFFWIAIANDVTYYRNPIFSLSGMSIYFMITFVVVPRAIYDTFLACIGSTVKQESYK